MDGVAYSLLKECVLAGTEAKLVVPLVKASVKRVSLGLATLSVHQHADLEVASKCNHHPVFRNFSYF